MTAPVLAIGRVTGVRGRAGICAVLLAYLVLGDRLVLAAAGSSLPLPAVALLGATTLAALQLREPPSRVLVGVAARTGFLAYLAVQALLPLLALLFLAAPVTALGAVLPAAVGASGLLLGAIAVADPALRRDLVQRVVPLAMAAHAGWAAVQAARTAGLLPSALRELSLAVDLRGLAGLAPIPVFGRSTGLLANPNALGLWAAAGFLFAVQFLDGRRRTLTCVGAVFCLAASGSRGGLVAFGAGLLTLGAHTEVRRRRGEGGRRRDRRASLRVARIALLCLVPAVVGLVLQWDRFVEPFAGMAASVEADSALSARLGFWEGAWQFLGERPAGTILTPEYVLGTSIDSDVFRTLAQGGALFLATLVIGYGTVLLRTVRSPRSALLGLVVVFIVAGTTMNALLYLPALLLWIAFGLAAAPPARAAP